MKKILIIFMCLLLPVFVFTGCKSIAVINQTSYDIEVSNSMFEIIEVTESFFIVYHKDTKVMYSVSRGTYNYGIFTLLVDVNGLPLVYGG